MQKRERIEGVGRGGKREYHDMSGFQKLGERGMRHWCMHTRLVA